MKFMVLNAGSSSSKISLYEFGKTLPVDPSDLLWEAKIEWHGEIADVTVKTSTGPPQQTRFKVSSHIQAVEDLIRRLWSGESAVVGSPSDISAVGHRIVHGGPQYEEPVRITPDR